jgi:hypothetical protein
MSSRSKKKLRERMNYRDAPEHPALNYRSAPLTQRADCPSTLDEKTRSVEVVMTTEAPARVYDYDRGVISEVLLMGGAQMPANNQLVLLDTHSRYETANIIGSVREMRLAGDQIIGRAYYSSAPEAESPWIKTREGHLTDYSIGYRVDESVWVPEGQTTTIVGRLFTGPVQVAIKWTPRELSAVPIGADQNAKARSETHKQLTSKEDVAMDKKIRAMLEAKGLPATATEEEAIAFMATLEVRSEPKPKEEKIDLDKVRAEATGKGLERIREIDALLERYGCQDMARELIVGESGKEPPTLTEAQRKVMDKIHEKSTKAEKIGISGIVMGADEQDKFRAAASQALELRAGMKVEKAAPGAHELRGYTMVEMARECLRVAGKDRHGSTKEIVGRALTTSDFPNILANLATKSMQQGWLQASETWQQWCGIGSVSDFKTYYDNALSEHDDLEEIPDSGEIKMGSFSEKAPETYKATSYGKKFKITRVMIINDDMNALTSMPAKRAEAAARKVGDVAYAVLTGNGNMGDGHPIFSTTYHGNDAISGIRGVPGITALEAAILAIGTQKDISGKRRLNISAKYFVAPKALEGKGEIFFRSGNYSDSNTIATDSSLASTRVNPYGGTYFERVYEPRLDDDSATAYYIMGPKGKTVIVVFLNGQQSPILEMTQPGFTVEGFEYAVVMDAGAYASDYRGMYRNEGA